MHYSVPILRFALLTQFVSPEREHVGVRACDESDVDALSLLQLRSREVQRHDLDEQPSFSVTSAVTHLRARVGRAAEGVMAAASGLVSQSPIFGLERAEKLTGLTERDWWRVGVVGFIASIGLVLCGCACTHWCLGRKQEEVREIRDDIERLHAHELALEGKLQSMRETREKLEHEAFAQDSPEVLRKDLRGLNAAVDKFVENNASAGVKKVQSFVQRRELLDSMLNRKYEEEQASLTTHMSASASALAADLKSLLELSDDDLAPLMEDKGPGAARQLPPLAIVLAGICAPLQLACLVTTNSLFLAWHLALLIFDVVVLLNFPDLGQCTEMGRRSIRWEAGWLCVHALLHLIASSGRVWVAMLLRNTYRRIADRVEKPGFAKRWFGGMSFLFQTDVDNPRALFLYDYVTGSYVYKATSCLLVLDFFWNLTASFALWQGQTPCSEDAYDFFFLAVRVYSTLFTMFFLLNTILVAAWIGFAFLMRPATYVSVLRKLRSWDEKWCPKGFPIGTLFLRTFVLRDATDRWRAEHECVVTEKRQVEEEEEAIRKRLEVLVAEKEALAREEAKMARTTLELRETEDEYVEAWFDGLNTAFGTAREPGQSGDSLSTLLRKTQQDAEEALRAAQETDAYRAANQFGERAIARGRAGMQSFEEAPFFHIAAERLSPTVKEIGQAANAAMESDAVKGIQQRFTAAMESDTAKQLQQQVTSAMESDTAKQLQQQVASAVDSDAARQLQQRVASVMESSAEQSAAPPQAGEGSEAPASEPAPKRGRRRKG